MQLDLTVHLSATEFFHNTEFALGAWGSRGPCKLSEPVLQNADHSHSTNHSAALGENHLPAFYGDT